MLRNIFNIGKIINEINRRIDEAGIRLNNDEFAINELRNSLRQISNRINEVGIHSNNALQRPPFFLELPEAVVEVEKKYKFIEGSWMEGLTPTFTNMELESARMLYSLVGLVRPEKILETGTHQGYSAALMAQALRDFNIEGKIFTIDPFMVSHLFENNHLQDYVTWFNKLSTEIESLKLPKSFDLIFLDSDHTYDTLSAEVEIYEPLLIEEGLLVLHDTIVFKDLWPVVDSLVASKRFEVINLPTPRNWARTDMNGSGLTICKKIKSGAVIKQNKSFFLNSNIDKWISESSEINRKKSIRSVFFKN